MYELDTIDLRILDLLQQQGRLTMTELGESVGLSTSPCSQRVKRLEQLGVITGYYARINPQALGRSLLVFVEITLTEKSEQIFKKVRDALAHIPEVQECHLIAGRFDYLIKARLGGMNEYRRLLGTILAQMPVPAQSNRYVVMEEVTESPALRAVATSARRSSLTTCTASACRPAGQVRSAASPGFSAPNASEAEKRANWPFIARSSRRAAGPSAPLLGRQIAMQPGVWLR